MAAARKWFQFNLLALFSLVTGGALGTWTTINVGWFPLVALAVAIACGCVCGLTIGCIFLAPRSATVGGLCGAILGNSVLTVWVLSEGLRLGELEQMRGLPFYFPFMHIEMVLYVTVPAFLGAVPFAAVGAVHRRQPLEVLAWPAIVCAYATMTVGFAVLALEVWQTGRFPEPPLPWPIAFAISLGGYEILTVGAGLLTGLAWLFVRYAYSTIAQRTWMVRV
jgi:hypothetical protein